MVFAAGIVLVAVSRLPGQPRTAHELWLWRRGPDEALGRDVRWRAAVCRFDLAQSLRFCTQRLGWTTPRIRSPEQADRGTRLVVAAYAQLPLAWTWIADRHLPWQRPLALGTLTASRVRRALSALLAL